MPGTPTCGPFSEGGVFTRPDGTQVVARGPFNANFDGITYQKTIGFSNYNALEVSLRHSSRTLEAHGRLHLQQVAGRFVQPLRAGLSLRSGADQGDLRLRPAAQFRGWLPLPAAIQLVLAAGTRIAGPMAGGSPALRASPADFRSRSTTTPTARCWARCRTASTTMAWTRPSTLAATSHVNTNPRNGQAGVQHRVVQRSRAWAPSATRRVASSMGRVWRTSTWPCRRDFSRTERKALQFRVEAFNVFNHAQFFGADAVNGNISSAGFGQIVNAMPPRQVQLALKFAF